MNKEDIKIKIRDLGESENRSIWSFGHTQNNYIPKVELFIL